VGTLAAPKTSQLQITLNNVNGVWINCQTQISVSQISSIINSWHKLWSSVDYRWKSGLSWCQKLRNNLNNCWPMYLCTKCWTIQSTLYTYHGCLAFQIGQNIHCKKWEILLCGLAPHNCNWNLISRPTLCKIRMLFEHTCCNDGAIWGKNTTGGTHEATLWSCSLKLCKQVPQEFN